MAKNLEIKPTNQSVEGDKRQYLPFTISFNCENCNARRCIELTTDYLGYPVWNEPYDFHLYCHECDHSEKLEVIPKVDIVLANAEPDNVQLFQLPKRLQESFDKALRELDSQALDESYAGDGKHIRAVRTELAQGNWARAAELLWGLDTYVREGVAEDTYDFIMFMSK